MVPAARTPADDAARDGVRATWLEARASRPTPTRDRIAPGTPVPANRGYVNRELGR